MHSIRRSLVPSFKLLTHSQRLTCAPVFLFIFIFIFDFLLPCFVRSFVLSRSSLKPETSSKLNGVMRTLRSVHAEDEKTKEMFEPLRNTVALLKKHSVKVDEIIIDGRQVNDVLEDAPLSWKNLVKDSYDKKAEIFELQKVN